MTDAEADKQELLRLNAEYHRCIVQRDVAGFSRLLADDYSMIGPDGERVKNKEDRLNYLKEPGNISDVAVYVYGDSGAVHGVYDAVTETDYMANVENSSVQKAARFWMNSNPGIIRSWGSSSPSATRDKPQHERSGSGDTLREEATQWNLNTNWSGSTRRLVIETTPRDRGTRP